MGLKSVFDKLTDTSSGSPAHVDPSPPEGEEGCRTHVAPMSHLGQGTFDDDVRLRLGRGRVRHDGPEVGVGA